MKKQKPLKYLYRFLDIKEREAIEKIAKRTNQSINQEISKALQIHIENDGHRLDTETERNGF